MKITVLGCGSSVGVPALRYGWGDCDPRNSKNRRTRSSIIIETEKTSLLVDMSPDLRQQLLDSGVSRVDAVILTHEHYDHSAGLNELRPFFFDTDKILPIYCYRNSIEIVKKCFFYLFAEHFGNKPYMYIEPLDHSFTIGNICGICIEQNHGHTKSMGLRIGNFAYTTDVVAFSKESFSKLYGLDVWIVGCPSPEKKHNHAHLEIILEWVEELKPRMTYLTHMGFEMDYDNLLSILPHNVRPAYDQMQIEVAPVHL
ncbi:MAG: MBL fold metallo-hydrolase [Holosporaceae bacterium]|jgi:phosphoribosyl 1,2-cyclic phosphate phosphodiesterase|nr:MBL fold metallo-hydrolase [Holosporaceae bacterium]